MARAADLSVVIVNWNNVAELRACLASLYDDGAAEHQVIVVDNGSSDDSARIARREFPAVELIETGVNHGFAEGANRGIARARGEWVFALNNDATVARGGLAALATLAADAGPDVGMLQPTLIFKDRPHHTNSLGIAVTRDGGARDIGFGRLVEPMQRREIFCSTAGACLYRRAMLDELRLDSGVFDRTFFMYYEDFDLGWRARLAGWRAFHDPGVTIAHRHMASSRVFGRRWLWRLTERNRVRTLLKNASLEVCRRAFGSMARAALWSIARGSDGVGPIASALRDGWRQRAEVERLVRVPRQEVERAWLR